MKREGFRFCVLVSALLFATLQAAAPAQQLFNLSLQGNVTIAAGTYYSIPVAPTNLSFVVYSVSSDVPVYTLVMNGSEYSAFKTAPNANDSLIVNYANSTIEAMLQNRTRYIVIYSPYSEANASYSISATSNFSHTNATTYAGAYVHINPHGTGSYPLHIETKGSPFNLTLLGISDNPVYYSIYDNTTGQTVFNTTYPSTVTNLNTSGANATYGYDLRLQPGSYMLNITNAGGGNATVYYTYKIHPDYVDPFLLNGFDLSEGFAPIGIASFGLLYRNGVPVPYNISATQIVGYANITSLEVNNPTNATTANITGFSNGLSMQLNDVLVVTDKNGDRFVYWPQDVAFMTTNSSTSGMIQMEDNILNMSGDCAILSNSSVYSTSGGYVSELPVSGQCSQFYYGIYNRSTAEFNYTLPLRLYLVMNVSVLPGTGTMVSMGVRYGNNSTVWFDNVTLLDPNVSDAHFYVSGNQYTPAGASSPGGTYYDSELVFGGPGNGALANFTSANAELQMYYFNSTTHELDTFPSAYTFGADTAEAAANLSVNYSNGYAVLSLGTPRFDNLYMSPPKSVYVKNGESVPSPPSQTAEVQNASYLIGSLQLSFGIVFLLVLLAWHHIRLTHARKHRLIRSPIRTNK